MSEEEQEGFVNEDVRDYLVLSSKFQLALSLTKYCAQSCNIFNVDANSKYLTSNETNCIKKCAANIDRTYPQFASSVKEAVDFEENLGFKE